MNDPTLIFNLSRSLLDSLLNIFLSQPGNRRINFCDASHCTRSGSHPMRCRMVYTRTSCRRNAMSNCCWMITSMFGRRDCEDNPSSNEFVAGHPGNLNGALMARTHTEIQIECNYAAITVNVHAVSKQGGLVCMGSPCFIQSGTSKVSFPKRHKKRGSPVFRTKTVPIVLFFTDCNRTVYRYDIPARRKNVTYEITPNIPMDVSE